mmetsp:Transcript_18226/g.28403  ORF Transcript_18226/g.28403 Transcript_18226/m.28403 type:complete len:217 (+) Transcript_18226:639-1289(+)
MISKPDVGPAYTAQTRLQFRAPTILSHTTCSSSGSTISLISNNLKPLVNDALLLCCKVFSNPVSKVVRTTWYSTLAGFNNSTAGVTGFRSAVKFSWHEERPCVNTSTYPARLISSRSKSPRAFKGCSPPTVHVVGTLLTMLLYPNAIPMSSATSTACKISLLVGGTVTSKTVPSDNKEAGPSCTFSHNFTISSAGKSIPIKLFTKSIAAVSLRRNN